MLDKEQEGIVDVDKLLFILSKVSYIKLYTNIRGDKYYSELLIDSNDSHSYYDCIVESTIDDLLDINLEYIKHYESKRVD